MGKDTKNEDKIPNSGNQDESKADQKGSEITNNGNGKKGFKVSGIRYVVIALACVGMIVINAMRTNVGFTVLTILDKETEGKVGTFEALMNLPNVDWNSKMVGFLHSSFYIGYILTHMPAGYLTTVMPSHRIFGGSILLSCALNLLLPMAISADEYILTCIIRFVQGLVEGSLYPGCYGVIRYWTTPSERGRTGSAVLTGAYAGAVVGFPVAGLITHYIGWQYVFYVNGGAGILWVTIWMLFVCEKPSEHPFIKKEELNYITKEQGYSSLTEKKGKLPVKDILSSPPVLSLCLCHFARNWVFILMLTNEPFYLSLFDFTVAENGIYASIPHVMKVLAAISSGCIADYLALDSLLSTTDIRKLLTGVGFGVAACGFFILTFLHRGSIVLVFLTITIGFSGFAVSGWQINHYDLSTQYASFLVGVSSTFGNLGSIVVPLITGYITMNHTLTSWNIVFYITSGILALAVASFLLFGSGQQQPWANAQDDVVVVQKFDPLDEKPYAAEPVQDSVKPSSAT